VSDGVTVKVCAPPSGMYVASRLSDSVLVSVNRRTCVSILSIDSDSVTVSVCNDLYIT